MSAAGNVKPPFRNGNKTGQRVRAQTKTAGTLRNFLRDAFRDETGQECEVRLSKSCKSIWYMHQTDPDAFLHTFFLSRQMTHLIFLVALTIRKASKVLKGPEQKCATITCSVGKTQWGFQQLAAPVGVPFLPVRNWIMAIFPLSHSTHPSVSFSA